MAIAKVCGIETEYGIHVIGSDLDPITASSLIVSSYKESTPGSADFNHSGENPSSDARGVNLDDYLDPMIDSKLLNTVLSNGARYYVDHAHPEYSSPECLSIHDAVLYDVAGEHILRLSMERANSRLPASVNISLFKNNSDGKCNSYGCHENYLVNRRVPFAQLAAMITSHFVTRQIYCGAGKVGKESPTGLVDPSGYQLSQRADFFEEIVGLETTMKRPIVNTRDEPHCDAEKYRRLHVIVGDANMSQFATFLKLGTTALILSMIEDGFFPQNLYLAHPVHAIKQVSSDPSLKTNVLLSNGNQLRALEVQSILCEYATRYIATHDEIGLQRGEAELIVSEWQSVLNRLQTSPDSLASKIDWIAKKQLVDGFASRHNLQSDHPKLKAIDLMYHAVNADSCLANRIGLDQLITSSAVESAIYEPPVNTRAYFRGKVVYKWPDKIVNANWDSVIFDADRGPLKRVELQDPFRGTQDLVGQVIEQSMTVNDLLARLGSDSDSTDTL